ncbi:MAG: SagB/ThcOx family dehydrogenase [Prevotellaceae bacterium]|jgi:SagB-type dehydrogenase family enzyme|nr:SagB/ThcOx family dehydrogenase [Prevotellaceae bacterium]
MKHHFFILSSLLFLMTSCQQPAKTQEETTKVEKTFTEMDLTTFETIKLTAPAVESGQPLLTAMQNRKSDREFSDKNLSLEHLSEILWAANGINRAGENKRTVPSAMAIYPLDTYVFLANGVYKYIPETHELTPVVAGDHRALSGLQPFVETAPLNLVFIADYHKYSRVPAERRIYLAALDAGHCAQNVYLYCASEGLKSVVRAGAQEQAVLELLGLDENYQFVVAQTVGY